MKIKLTADSTCDLSQELIRKMGVTILPLSILKGDQAYRDGLEIMPQDIYHYTDTTGKTCKTAAVNTADYQEVFEKYSKDYDGLIHISISSEFSSCYQNACLAAEGYPGVHVVDSRNLSTGSGHLVLEAWDRIQAGLEAGEIARQLRELTQKVEASFVIDTLDYLHKGGRCSSVAALGANLLKLKPCIEVRDGKMQVGKKYRGSYDRCILQYVTDRLQGREDLDLHRIFVTHSGCQPQLVEAVKQRVQQLQPFQEVLETTAGCTISSHCGPNTLGVLFIRK